MKKRVLITGGAGFIAHHTIKHILNHTDWEIVSLDRLDYSGNLNRISDMMNEISEKDKRRLRVVHHDLRAEVNDMLAADLGKFNFILHMAASSHVDRSITDPLTFVYDNVVATCNILNFARKSKNLELFIYFSTDEVFGPAPNKVKYKERERYNSTNPYSATKAGGEELAVAFENSYHMPIFITHTMNVFGERQHPEKFIPKCIISARDNLSVEIHSNKNKTKAGVFKFTAKNVPAMTPKRIKIPNDFTILKSTALYSIWVLVDIIDVGIIIAKDVPTDKCILVTISKSKTVKA